MPPHDTFPREKFIVMDVVEGDWQADVFPPRNLRSVGPHDRLDAKRLVAARISLVVKDEEKHRRLCGEGNYVLERVSTQTTLIRYGTINCVHFDSPI